MSEIHSNPFLRETETWVDRSGNEHQLKDMTENYLRHVLGFLESIEDALFAAEIDDVTAEQLVAVFEPWRYPDAHRSVDFPNARLWLHSTPLVEAITGLLGNQQPDRNNTLTLNQPTKEVTP